MDSHRDESRGRKVSEARPIEGEQLRELLEEAGVQSLEELDAMRDRGEELPGTHRGTVLVAWKEGEVGAEVERQLKELGVRDGEPLVLGVEWPDEPTGSPDSLHLKIALRHAVDPEHPETIDLAVVYAAERWRNLQARRS